MSEHVYTGGTFDLLHWGHLRFLERCAGFGDVTVALNTDDFVKEYKGSPPVLTFGERRDALLGCRFVNDVVENTGGQDSRQAIQAVAPTMIAIGSDWARRDYYAQMGFDQDWLDDLELALVYIPYTKGISSTELRNRLQAR